MTGAGYFLKVALMRSLYPSSVDAIARWEDRSAGWIEYAIRNNVVFGVSSSQRAETMHSCLKSHLRQCESLADLVKGCDVVIWSQYAEYCRLVALASRNLAVNYEQSLVGWKGGWRSLNWVEILASEYTNNPIGREPSIDCSCDAPTNCLLSCFL